MKQSALVLVLSALLWNPLGIQASGGVQLSAGSASGDPGDTVTIPISIDSASGVEVSGLNFDLSFDASRLTLDHVSAGPAATSAEKSVSSSTPSSGTVRVIVFGLNQTAIPDGTLVNVFFEIKAGSAPGTIALPLGNAAASSPAGSSVPISTSAGSLTIQAPPPTAVPTSSATSTLTPSLLPTNTATATKTSTAANTAAPTTTIAPSGTVPPSPTPTSSQIPPTASPTQPGPTATNTQLSATATGAQGSPTTTRTELPGSPTIPPATGTPTVSDPRAGREPTATQRSNPLSPRRGGEGMTLDEAVAATATELARFDASVQATATALAEGVSGRSDQGAGPLGLGGSLAGIVDAIRELALGEVGEAILWVIMVLDAALTLAFFRILLIR